MEEIDPLSVAYSAARDLIDSVTYLRIAAGVHSWGSQAPLFDEPAHYESFCKSFPERITALDECLGDETLFLMLCAANGNAPVSVKAETRELFENHAIAVEILAKDMFGIILAATDTEKHANWIVSEMGGNSADLPELDAHLVSAAWPRIADDINRLPAVNYDDLQISLGTEFRRARDFVETTTELPSAAIALKKPMTVAAEKVLDILVKNRTKKLKLQQIDAQLRTNRTPLGEHSIRAALKILRANNFSAHNDGEQGDIVTAEGILYLETNCPAA
jgi:hypothetical protein